MAERVGFEPTVRFPVRSLSRRVLSTAQSPLRSRFHRSRGLRRSAIRGDRELPRDTCPERASALATCSKESLQDGGALVGENSAGDLHAMIQPCVG